MPVTSSVQDDLGYVRDVVSRAEGRPYPSAIAYLWAAVVLIGFSLVDFAPEGVAAYWAIAAPAGFLVSAWLGWRHSRAIGQQSAREGRRELLHWGALMAAIFLLYPLIARGELQGEAIAQVILLIVALAYFLAGVHTAPTLKWAALAMSLGYLATVTMDGMAWSALGVLSAAGLVLSARLAGDGRGNQQR